MSSSNIQDYLDYHMKSLVTAEQRMKQRWSCEELLDVCFLEQCKPFKQSDMTRDILSGQIVQYLWQERLRAEAVTDGGHLLLRVWYVQYQKPGEILYAYPDSIRASQAVFHCTWNVQKRGWYFHPLRLGLHIMTLSFTQIHHDIQRQKEQNEA